MTTWQPPDASTLGVLEVLHTGPYFRGPGTFELRSVSGGSGTEVRCIEIFDVVGGAVPTRLAALLLPGMRVGFARSLRALGRVSSRWPVKIGDRLARKASTACWWSSVAPVRAISSASYASASVSELWLA